MINCSNWEMTNVLLNSIMENCPDIITVKDLDFKYLAFNKAFLNTVKLSPSELLNKSAKDILSEETFTIMQENLNCIIKTGKPKTFTLRVQSKTSDKFLTQTTTPILENGKITKLLSISHDVTIEERLKMKLLEKFCQLNTLLEYIPLLVYMKDKNCKYITGSKFAKDFINSGIDYYCDNVCIDLEFTENIVNHEDLSVMSYKCSRINEIEAKTTSGLKQWYKTYKAPIYKLGKVNGIVTIAKNITKEKQLETQKELFLATLTHDLKNPVQALSLSLKMLNNEKLGKLKPKQKEMLEMIIESANYMQDMLQSILSTYKFENGIITLRKEEFDPKTLIKTCINEIKAFANTKNIKLVCDIKTNENLFADKNQLRRVVSNLLNNALNYSFKNSELKIGLENIGENIIFKFENLSPEIPNELKEHIFEKYVTGKFSGIGLGLYFSQKVVEAHNGKIYLQSNGSLNKFVFEIPRKNNEREAIVIW